MEIKYITVSKIVPYKNNPRRNKDAVKFVANSISSFGFRNPIIIDENYEIICGHTRYLAAKKLKLDKVPCLICDDLSPDKIKAYRLADNKVSEIPDR